MSTLEPRLVASAATAAATWSAPSERAGVSDGTRTFTEPLAEGTCCDGLCDGAGIGSTNDLVDARRRHPPVDGLVDHHRGRARAIAEAIHGLEAEPAVGR